MLATECSASGGVGGSSWPSCSSFSLRKPCAPGPQGAPSRHSYPAFYGSQTACVCVEFGQKRISCIPLFTAELCVYLYALLSPIHAVTLGAVHLHLFLEISKCCFYCLSPSGLRRWRTGRPSRSSSALLVHMKGSGGSFLPPPSDSHHLHACAQDRVSFLLIRSRSQESLWRLLRKEYRLFLCLGILVILNQCTSCCLAFRSSLKL